MDCLDAIRERRSVRSFLNRPVLPDQIQTVLEAAILAPSARNLQPWRFHVYLNAEEIARLSRQVKDCLFGLPIDEPFASPMHAVLNSPDYKVFYDAPALILVIAADTTAQSTQDCCLAAENLMLAARSIGLGSAWVGTSIPWFQREETKRSLQIPLTTMVVAPIVLGYPLTWPTCPERRPPDVRWCCLSEEEYENTGDPH